MGCSTANYAPDAATQSVSRLKHVLCWDSNKVSCKNSFAHYATTQMALSLSPLAVCGQTLGIKTAHSKWTGHPALFIASEAPSAIDATIDFCLGENVKSMMSVWYLVCP